MDLNKWREKQFEVMSKYMHNKDTSSVGKPSMSDTSSVEMMPTREEDQKDSSPLSISSKPYTYASIPTHGGQLTSAANITFISDLQQERLDRFARYVTLEMNHDIQQLVTEVQKGIVESHFEHCYHQRPRINAVSAELDAKELVSIKNQMVSCVYHCIGI